jgi:hypothetical protein
MSGIFLKIIIFNSLINDLESCATKFPNLNWFARFFKHGVEEFQFHSRLLRMMIMFFLITLVIHHCLSLFLWDSGYPLDSLTACDFLACFFSLYDFSLNSLLLLSPLLAISFRVSYATSSLLSLGQWMHSPWVSTGRI